MATECTYDFSIFYTTLSHNLIEKKLSNLAETTIYREILFILLVVFTCSSDYQTKV